MPCINLSVLFFLELSFCRICLSISLTHTQWEAVSSGSKGVKFQATKCKKELGIKARKKTAKSCCCGCVLFHLQHFRGIAIYPINRFWRESPFQKLIESQHARFFLFLREMDGCCTCDSCCTSKLSWVSSRRPYFISGAQGHHITFRFSFWHTRGEEKIITTCLRKDVLQKNEG